jgi:hypothetical protein
MRSEAKRAYAVDMGRKILANNAAVACDSAGNGLDDFLKFCPGAGKIEALGPSGTSDVATTANRQIAQDSASTIWVFEFDSTNALVQRPINRDQFNKR